MNQKNIFLIGVIAAVIIIASVYFLFPEKGEQKNYDKFAQCLTEKGAVVYGGYRCTHCKEQEEMFGNSFKYINYIECDPSGPNAKPQLCNEAGITGTPTWIINRQKLVGLQSFEDLGTAANCTVE